MSQEERKRLKQVRREERYKLRFEKNDRKYGDADLRFLAERSGKSALYYRQWVGYRSAIAQDTWVLCGLVVLMIAGILLSIFTKFPVAFTNAVIGFTLAELFGLQIDMARADMEFHNIYTAIKFHNYDELVDMLKEALEEKKKVKEVVKERKGK